MDSNNDGGIWRTFLLALAVLVVVIGVAACGAPVLNSDGLSWDNSIWTNAQNQRTERERLRQNAETRQALAREETARIMSDNMRDTLIGLSQAGAAVGALALVAWSARGIFAAWAARPHRPAAVQRIEVRMTYEDAMRLAQPHLAALPDASVQWVDEVDGQPVNCWAVVSPSHRMIKRLTDSQRG